MIADVSGRPRENRGRRRVRRSLAQALCLLALVGLAACAPVAEVPDPADPAPEATDVVHDSLATNEVSDFVTDSSDDSSDLDDSIFPLSFLMNDATDYSGCNPDVEGDTACF